jgi:DNA polymerase-1
MFGVPIKGMPGEVRPPGEGDQFRHHLRHLGVWPRQPARHRPRGSSAYIKKYFERFPASAPTWTQTGILPQARLCRTLFGRKMPLPDIKASNASVRSFNERAAINARLQGTAADIIRRAMIRMEDALAEKKLSAQMLLQVHDELIFEVPDEGSRGDAAGGAARHAGRAVPGRAAVGAAAGRRARGEQWDEAH